MPGLFVLRAPRLMIYYAAGTSWYYYGCYCALHKGKRNIFVRLYLEQKLSGLAIPHIQKLHKLTRLRVSALL
jgi:hypothetical protein